MPGKSRRSHRKLSRSKQKRSILSPPPASQQRADAHPYTPVTTPKVAAPSASMPALTPTRFPYVVTELKRIAILTGIILVILVALSLVLS